jgi:hypothetical protein
VDPSFLEFLGETSLEKGRKPGEKNHNQEDAENVEKNINYRSLPAGDKGLIKFIQDGHPCGNEGRKDIAEFGACFLPRGKRKNKKKGQNPVQRNVQNAEGIKNAEFGYHWRIRPKKDNKDIRGR